MTGHMMSDEDPAWAARHSGRFLKNLSTFPLPGVDEIHTHLDDWREMTLFGAAEYASGENGAMAELFALGPCDMPYAKKRCMLYLAACHKINHYFLAISPLDMRGNLLVTDFFNNFGPDQPDFSGMRLLSREAKQAAIYASKDYRPDIYVRYPFEACVQGLTGKWNANPLAQLIHTLSRRQIQWKYIDDGEDAGTVPVIEPDGALGFTLNGRATDGDTICRELIVPLSVTDAEGNAPEGIFVRRFLDGSRVILNLFAPPGEYLVDGRPTYIYEHDVLLSHRTDDKKKTALAADFCVSYQNPSMLRLMYINEQTEAVIHCEEETAVAFAIRKGTEAYLDGQGLCAAGIGDGLFTGIRDLYRVSDKIILKKGVHTVRSANDFKYMPSVFLVGDFSAEILCEPDNGVKLSHRQSIFTPPETFSDYGNIEFLSDITVPEGAKAIELTGTKLYTRLYADQTLLGEHICAPYRYTIDQTLWSKKIRLRIAQYSSMAPIFGDTARWDRETEYSQWRGTPSTERTLFGFEQLLWIF